MFNEKVVKFLQISISLIVIGKIIWFFENHEWEETCKIDVDTV